jgi:hypothetical protein
LQYLAKTACPGAGSPAEGVAAPEDNEPLLLDDGGVLLSQAASVPAPSTNDKIKAPVISKRRESLFNKIDFNIQSCLGR